MAGGVNTIANLLGKVNAQNELVVAATVNVTAADGSIVDGVDPLIKATVKDYTNSNPLATILVDTNGDPLSVGGGTQYAQGTAATTTDVMTQAGAVRRDTPAVASGVADLDRAMLEVDSEGLLWTRGRQQLDGDSGAGSAPTDIRMIAVAASGGPVAVPGDATNGLDVDVTRLPALVAGSAIIGNVRIDQTTPGTTNGVQANAGTNLNTSALALEAGHIATVDTSTAALAAVAGVTSGAAVITDANGTLQQYLRGIIKLAITAGGWLVNVAQWGGTTVVNGGTAGAPGVGGIQAHDAALSGNNPVLGGGGSVNAEPAPVATGDLARFITDLVGKQIVLPYANPENFVSGAITSAMTGTTSTSLVAAPASGLRNYLTQITVSNSHATVGTNVLIQDGNGGATLYTIPAAAVYGGATMTFPTPLRQPTTATAVYVQNETTGASVKVSASGYKGA